MDISLEPAKSTGHRHAPAGRIQESSGFEGTTLHPLLTLQQKAGNQAVQNLLRNCPTAVKGRIGSASMALTRSSSVLARKEDASAGLDAGAGGQHEAQDKCVQRLGGCPETRSGGIPSEQDIQNYNQQCRSETGYSGPDVQPTCGPAAPEPEPLCKAVMGGRVVDHWLAGTLLRQEHTYVNFEEGGHRWLIEGGPDSDGHTTGAWVKPDNWESRGNRISTPYQSTAECSRVKTALFDTTTAYNNRHLAYDPSHGPNSNSFCEELTFKSGVPAQFTWWDHQWDYWQNHTRPF
jgi:hypothetical protein